MHTLTIIRRSLNNERLLRSSLLSSSSDKSIFINNSNKRLIFSSYVQQSSASFSRISRNYSSQSNSNNNDNSSSKSNSETPGMDLFERAMRAQQAKRQQQQASSHQQQSTTAAAAGSSSSSTSSTSQQSDQSTSSNTSNRGPSAEEEPLYEELTPEEKERQKRWKEQTDQTEAKRMAKSGSLGSILFVLGLIGGYAYLGMPTTTDKEDGFSAHHRRVMANLSWGYKSTVEPPSVKLLPDPLPEPYQRPYTLCLELNDNLVHTVWDPENGWRVATRPGVNQFLSYLSRYFELVIFTTSQNYIAQPVIQTIDPYNYVMYNLYRDSTRLISTKHVKDISCLNRDLGKVIIVDSDPANFQLQPENGIVLKSWKGDNDKDNELPKLMKFLEEFALLASIVNLQDVRPLLKTIKDRDPSDPWRGWCLRKEELRAEFAQYDRTHQKQNPAAQAARESDPDLASAQSTAQQSTLDQWTSAVTGVFGALFGRGIQNRDQQGQGDAGHGPNAAADERAKRGASSSGGSGSGQSTNLIDLIERAANEEFQLFMKDQKAMLAQLEEHKRQMEEEQQRHLQAMKEKKLKLVDYMMGAGVPPGGAPGAPQGAAALPSSNQSA